MTPTPRHTRPLPFAPILIAAFAVAIGLWFGARYFAAPPVVRTATAVMYPQPRALPEFRLQQTDGTALTLADWRGHWTLVYFGYASCPDVCPTTLATLKSVWNDLPQETMARWRFDFVSVDPKRDTADVLRKYVTFFRPEFHAATGSDEQLTLLSRALGLMYSRTPTGNGDESVDHSGSVVIVDPQARLVGIFRPPFSAPAIEADLKLLNASGG